jgi:hypothetical protein
MLSDNGTVVGGNGSVFTGGATNNVFGGSGTLALNGNVTISNLSIAVGTLAGNGVVSGSFAWTGGALGYGYAGNGIPFCSLTVATNGVIAISGTNSLSLNGILTNAGTVNWSGTGNLEINANQAGISQDGAIVNLTKGLFNVQNDRTIQANNVNGYVAYFNNAGTFLKSAGTNTTISVNFTNNAGALNSQAGTISFTGSYKFNGGTLGVGIGGTTNFGAIHFAGSIPLNGLNLTANLENGFVPSVSNSFAVVSFGSRTGIFTTANFPTRVLWQTNYGSTNFTITVFGVIPVFTSFGLTNAAPNQPAQFQLLFSGSTNSIYTVLASTNLALPLANWNVLGNATLLTNNLFLFTDTQSTNFIYRFYFVQSP